MLWLVNERQSHKSLREYRDMQRKLPCQTQVWFKWEGNYIRKESSIQAVSSIICII